MFYSGFLFKCQRPLRYGVKPFAGFWVIVAWLSYIDLKVTAAGSALCVPVPLYFNLVQCDKASVNNKPRARFG